MKKTNLICEEYGLKITLLERKPAKLNNFEQHRVVENQETFDSIRFAFPQFTGFTPSDTPPLQRYSTDRRNDWSYFLLPTLFHEGQYPECRF